MNQSILYFACAIGLYFVVLNVRAAPQEIKNPDCLCATTDDLRRVCGSDGKTYDNLSELECSVKCERTVAEFAYDGPCESVTEKTNEGDEGKGGAE